MKQYLSLYSLFLYKCEKYCLDDYTTGLWIPLNYSNRKLFLVAT